MKKICFVAGLLIQVWGTGCTQLKSEPAKITQQALPSNAMRPAVTRFLNALTRDQKVKTVYAFVDAERFNWHFVPRKRNGLPLKEMTKVQRELALTIMQTALSESGYGQAKAIMELEVILKALENRSTEDHYRDPENYYFTVFGIPSDKAVWGWRVEGHHLSLNFSSATGQVIAATPAFMGSNPAIVPAGPEKGKQILKQEVDLAFSLLHSFTPEQLKKASIATVAPNDIVTGNSRKVMLQNPTGILYPDLTLEQQKLLIRLINVYLNKYKKDLAQAMYSKLEKAGLNKIHFAWAGSQEPVAGQAHYYRIQNPAILIEYDNSQNNANHVHSVIRDLTNDFGEDALQAHYQKHRHQK